MESKCFTLHGQEWRYKGEGNAHLALSLPKDQLVVRLEKTAQENPIEECLKSSKVKLEVDFIATVVTKLFTRHFVTPPQIVYLRAEEIENINKVIHDQRPENRRHKKVGSCEATLWPDLCFLPNNLSSPSLPTFSVEIKPKQGVFAPSDQGTERCLFCLKQDLKLMTGAAHERSEYCPLNLFSGDKDMMMAALKGLLHTPQNNLTVFKDGKPVFGDGTPPEHLQEALSEWLQPVDGTCLEERFRVMLLDVLTRKMDADKRMKGDELGWLDDGLPLLCRIADSAKRPKEPIHGAHDRCHWGRKGLPHGSVLQRLAAVQELDVCGHAAAYELYRQEVNQGSDDYGYVKSIMDAGCSTALSPLQCYLMAALARDCSIAIAFQRAPDPKPNEQTLPVVTDPPSGTNYIFQIRLMDVDPKPLSCIEKHHKRNWDIAQARKNLRRL